MPKDEARSVPKLFDIFKLLPIQEECPKKCGPPTCMIFAKLPSEGVKTPADCPHLGQAKMEMRESCLAGLDPG